MGRFHFSLNNILKGTNPRWPIRPSYINLWSLYADYIASDWLSGWYRNCCNCVRFCSFVPCRRQHICFTLRRGILLQADLRWVSEWVSEWVYGVGVGVGVRSGCRSGCTEWVSEWLYGVGVGVGIRSGRVRSVCKPCM